MAIDYKKYPPNWKTEIRPRILERAKHCCEECGVKNYAIGARDRYDEWHDLSSIEHMSASYGDSLWDEYPDCIRIVLTISHTDHDITHNTDDNLRALCQRCHNRHDAKMRAGHAKVTRRKNKELATGQINMFGGD